MAMDGADSQSGTGDATPVVERRHDLQKRLQVEKARRAVLAQPVSWKQLFAILRTLGYKNLAASLERQLMEGKL
jgi:hypothetical protein